MTTNAVVRTRIKQEIKDEASIVLEAMGLTLSDAVRILLIRIAKEKALPFEPLIPSEATIKAMKAARKGELERVKSTDDLLLRLNNNEEDD